MDINIEKFKQLQNNENTIILDVRTQDEFQCGFIKNAINYDIYQLEFKEDILKLDRDKLYLVYCRSGARSGQAVELMRQNNFKTSYNLIGGILEWNINGEELIEPQE